MLGKEKDKKAPISPQDSPEEQNRESSTRDSVGVGRENTKKEKKDELKKAKKERDEYLDGWKRAKADLINYKRDELKRLEHVIQFANEEMIVELVNVLDSFELALATLKDDPAEKGVYLIRAKLLDALKKRGLAEIEVEKGEKFDPKIHEAIDMVSPSSERTLEGKEGKSGTIAEEVETGYTLHDKVVRASKVKVYK